MSGKSYNISFSIDVLEDANFLESDRNSTLDNLEDLIRQALYDIDDIKLNWIEVQEE